IAEDVRARGLRRGAGEDDRIAGPHPAPCARSRTVALPGGAAMSLPWWLEIFLGLGLGYLVGSWVESFMHEHVSDAHPRRVKAWMRSPRLLRPLINTHYSHHTIHHVRTFRAGHTTQFRSEEERSQLTEVLLARGRHGRIIIAGAFGTRLHGSGALVFVAPLGSSSPSSGGGWDLRASWPAASPCCSPPS